MNEHGIITNELEWNMRQPAILTIFVGLIIFTGIPILLCQDYSDYRKSNEVDKAMKEKEAKYKE